MRIAFVASLLLVGCASLPTVVPIRSQPERDATVQACLRAFPSGKWSASHTIDAHLPLDNNALMVGVTSVEAGGMTSVLLSPEGLTLFEATVKDNVISVRRALPPLDRLGFARGLVEDVRGAFFAPAGVPTLVGHSEEGARVCRWSLDDDRTTDVELQGDIPRWVRMFEGTHLVRGTELVGDPDEGWYPRVVLRTSGVGGYTLDMRLIDHSAEDSAAPSVDDGRSARGDAAPRPHCE